MNDTKHESSNKLENKNQQQEDGYGTLALDCGKSFVQSAVISPVVGIGQIATLGYLPDVSIVSEPKSNADAWAQQIGSGLGSVVPMFALNNIMKSKFLGQSAACVTENQALSKI